MGFAIMLTSFGVVAKDVVAQDTLPSSLVVTGNNGLFAGNGDGANPSTADLGVESWWGLGFKATCCTNPGITWNYPIVFDTRAGNIYVEGNVGIGTASPTTILDINGGEGAPATSGVMNTGVIVSRSSGGVAINLGVMDTGVVGTGYGWLSAAYANSANVGENFSLQPNGGNVGIGTTTPGAKLEVDGNVKLTTGSGASITFQDGTVQSTAYTGVTCGGDYAESVDVSGDRTNYEPGDVLVIDPNAPGKFLKANESYSTMVAGIYSTKPGVVGRRQTTYPKTSTTEVPMAMVGIVPTKVSAENGPIKVGDLLVASSTLGRAMKGTDRSQFTGAVIGKALGSLDSGTGVIEVLVTLQ